MTIARSQKAARKFARRQLRHEILESRHLLAFDVGTQNPIQPLDVNVDAQILPIDALIVINDINRNGSRNVQDVTDRGFVDVTGDGVLSPRDALFVINAINRSDPVLSGRLLVDSAPDQQSNFDFITNSFGLELGVDFASANTIIEGRVNGDADSPFADVTNLFEDGTLRLNESTLNQLAGAEIEDGENRFEFRLGGDENSLSFTVLVDREAPQLSLPGGELIRVAQDEITVDFGESVLLEQGDFSITSASGANPTIIQAESSEFGSTTLTTQAIIPDGDFELSYTGSVSDLAGNQATTTSTTFQVADPTGVTAIAPVSGDRNVRLNRPIVVSFDEPVDPATVTPESFYVDLAGRRVTGEIRIGEDNQSARLIPDTNFSASTTGRIVVDGGLIRGADGIAIDPDGNNEPGGEVISTFGTVGLTRIEGTSVNGFIFDSTPAEDGSNVPVVGLTLRVEGLPELTAVTDENGFFRLEDTPGTEFFVILDTSTITSVPEGFRYLAPDEPFVPVAGQDTRLTRNGEPSDIFLPLVADTEAITVVEGQETIAQLGEAALDNLAEIIPDVPREQLALLSVEIPADSLFFDDGTPAEEVQIFGIDPERLPGPLPVGVDSSFVFSIDAGGANDFGTTAQVTFPNVDNLPPGAERPIYTFDHDAGEWLITGRAVVSADGSVLVTDEGGVTTLGWKFLGFEARANFFGVPTEHNCSNPLVNPLQNVARSVVNGTDIGIEAMNAGAQLAELTGRDPSGRATIFGVAGTLIGLSTTASKFFNGEPVSTGEVLQAATDIISILPLGQISVVARFASLGLSTARAITLVEAARNAADACNDLRQFSFITSGFTFEQAAQDIISNYESRALIYGNSFDSIHPEIINLLTSIDGLIRRAEMVLDQNGDTNQAELSDFFTLILEVEEADNSVANSVGFADDIVDLQAVYDTAIESAIGSQINNQFEYRYLIDFGGSSIPIRGTSASSGLIFERTETGVAPRVVVWNPFTNTIGIGGLVVESSGQEFGIRLLPADQFSDQDQDGLVDLAEEVIGTRVDLDDTDGDGISDFAEIELGLNPLDGIAFPSGIIGNAQPTGEVRDVVVEGDLTNPAQQSAFLATGTSGLAIVDVSQFTQPSLLGEIDLFGDAVAVAADVRSQRAFVAAGFGGLHVVDISDPTSPQLLDTIRELGAVTQVGLVDGSIVAAGDSLGILDPLTGSVLAEIELDTQTGRFTDFFPTGDSLLAISGNSRLHSITFGDGTFTELSNIDIPTPPVRRITPADMRLFVANGVASISNGLEVQNVAASRPLERGGYVTFDVSDPANLSLISNIDTGDFQAGNLQTVLNGSGLAIVAGGFRGLQVHNASDPSLTFDLITEFPTPGSAEAVAVVGGIAFVADGSAGLQVINYREFDAQGIAPIVDIKTDVVDVDEATDGLQVVEGTTIRISSEITDDVQVRSAQLVVNGEVVETDLSFPYDFSVVASNLQASDAEITIQVIATDTGGNSASSNILSVDLVPDTVPPEIVSITPFLSQDGFFGRNLQLSVFAPDLNTPVGTSVVSTVGPDVEFVNLPSQINPSLVDVRYDISDSRIELDFSSARSSRFGSGEFNGVVFFDVDDSIAPIIGLNIDSSVNSLGLSNNDIQFDENSIHLNLAGKTINRDTVLALDVLFAETNTTRPFVRAGTQAYDIRFSEPLSDDSNQSSIFLVGAGADDAFGTADDFSIGLDTSLVFDDRVIRANSSLDPGFYRLVVNQDLISDRAGNLIGGGNNETEFEVREVVPLFQGVAPDIVFVVDVSASTNSQFEGAPVGDINADGLANTILDAELASLLVLNQELENLGFASLSNIAVVPFSNQATAIDVDPIEAGLQIAASLAADADGDGIRDVDQAIRSLLGGGGTNFSNALDEAIRVFDELGTAEGEGNLIFLSDGSGGGGFADQLQALRDRDVQIRAFGVGVGADIASLRLLDDQADVILSTDEFLEEILRLN